MLSGEISKEMAKETVEGLLFDRLKEELLIHLQRNLELQQDRRGKTQLNDEQIQLAEFILQHPDGFLGVVLSSIKVDVQILAEYSENAGLELRGW